MECGHTNTTKNEINQSQNSSANNSIRFARFGSSIASICINYKYAFFVLSCVLCLFCVALHERNVQIAARHIVATTEARLKSRRCITTCEEFFCFLFTHILRSFRFVHCSSAFVSAPVRFRWRLQKPDAFYRRHHGY